jgi:hypothetical protein
MTWFTSQLTYMANSLIMLLRHAGWNNVMEYRLKALSTGLYGASWKHIASHMTPILHDLRHLLRTQQCNISVNRPNGNDIGLHVSELSEPVIAGAALYMRSYISAD